MKHTIIAVPLLYLTAHLAYAQPTFVPGQDPEPTDMVWQKVEQLSDEFEGTALDHSKWQDEVALVVWTTVWGFLGRGDWRPARPIPGISRGRRSPALLWLRLDSPISVARHESFFSECADDR